MNRKIMPPLVIVALLLAACGPSAEVEAIIETQEAEPTEEPAPAETEAVEETAEAPEETAEPPPPEMTPSPEPYAGQPLPTGRGDYFSGSGACAICHTNLTDESGADVSTDTTWRASMMANAARDPYWQATVRAEVLENPDLRAVIENKCAQCHMPMASVTAVTGGEAAAIMDDGFLSADSALHAFAMDGVSCALCHQITEAGLGTEESFSGGYVIDTDAPIGERLTYGGFPMSDEQAAIMQNVSGFLPAQSAHLAQSETCATCHTLYTPYVDSEGAVAGVFPEQMPFLEWANSDYAETQTCITCHMPPAEGSVLMANTSTDPVSPFPVHGTPGGNAYMLTMLMFFAQESGATASTEQFQAAIDRTTGLLQTGTATVGIENAALIDSQLSVDVVIQNLTGHKFPTGFPSRRAWLHATVLDADGAVVFESGAVNPDGSIVGNDNDADPADYELHYAVISSPDQVQIYEVILGDTEGDMTTTLLRAAGYVKDNRLLPAGFDMAAAGEDTNVYGMAGGDEDFIAGGDRVRYEVDLGDASGPFTVQVELLYQSIGYRWAQNLGRYDADEITRFLAYYDAVANVPVVVAEASAAVGE